MNRNGSKDSLIQWLPILESYRAKLDMDSSGVTRSLPLRQLNSPESLESKLPTTEPDPIPVALAEQYEVRSVAMSDKPDTASIDSVAVSHKIAESAEPSRPEIVVTHVPVDGILKQLQKTRPILLGASFVSDSGSSVWPSAIVQERDVLWERTVEYLAARCHEKANKKTIIIRTHSESTWAMTRARTSSSLFGRAYWAEYDETKAGKARWYAQLTELSQWKLDYDLILFDLGEATSSMASKVGRLCNGVVVQLPEMQNARKTIKVLKSLQDEQLKILGVWTTENVIQPKTVRSRAA